MKKVKIIGIRLINVIGIALQGIFFVVGIFLEFIACVTVIPWLLLYMLTGYVLPSVAILSLFITNKRVKCQETMWPYKKVWCMKHRGGLTIDSFDFQIREVKEM